VTVPSGQASSDNRDPSLGELVAEASTHMSTLVRGEIELAKTELRSSVKNAGAGVGMFIAAGVLIVFSLTFGLIALAEGLVALHIWRWASYLIVFGLLLLVVAALVLLGIRSVKRVKAPQRSIASAKETATFLRHPTKA
jgi:uncharacterized membrane protein YqjE